MPSMFDEGEYPLIGMKYLIETTGITWTLEHLLISGRGIASLTSFIHSTCCFVSGSFVSYACNNHFLTVCCKKSAEAWNLAVGLWLWWDIASYSLIQLVMIALVAVKLIVMGHSFSVCILCCIQWLLFFQLVLWQMKLVNCKVWMD